MSTAQMPALDMDKLNAFIGQFVTDGCGSHGDGGNWGKDWG